jgi:integrase
MRGHIVKRYKNSYTIVLNLGVDPATGKRKQQWISVKGNKRVAEKKLADLIYQLDTGSFIKPSKTTLSEFLERWIKDYVQPNLAPRTAEGYESIVRQHFIPRLGNITLTQLKPTHLQDYYAEELSIGRCDGKGGLKPQTVRHHHTALHKALQTALEWGLLNRNVADAVRPPHAERPEMHTWGEDEITHFLKAAKNTPYYALFYSALFTGMRRSELLALRWCDVDLLLCQVYVTRTVHQLRDGSIIYRPPKTAKGRRMIALSPSTALVLKEHKEKQEEIRRHFGFSVKDEDLIFSTLEGKPIRPNTVTRAWSDLSKRCGLNVIRLHDARHTHASLMLKQGIHPKIVQERLGHATIAVTLDTYSHVYPGLQEAAAKRFDESFSNSYNKPVENELVKNNG